MVSERRPNSRGNGGMHRDSRPMNNREHGYSGPKREPRPRPEYDENTVWYDVNCSECGEAFRVPFAPDPDRSILCKACLRASREARRPHRNHDSYRENTRRDSSSRENSYRDNAASRTESYSIVCSHCGKSDTVPFQPYEGSVVLCRDCKNNPNVERIGGKIQHTIICAVCGKENRVPFKPDPGSRVLCRECHAAEREEKQRSREYFAKNHPSVLNNVKTRIEIRCDRCGSLDSLPFVPKTQGQILCRQCAENTFGDAWARRNRIGAREFPFTCARCAAQDFVPFKPKEDQELLCRHCLDEQAVIRHGRHEHKRHDAFTCVRKAGETLDKSED